MAHCITRRGRLRRRLVRKGRMSNKTRLIIFLAITLAWMIVIFDMSGMAGPESRGLSDIICRLLSDILYNNPEPVTYNAETSTISPMAFVVRKTAHMFEFAVLAVLMVIDLELIRKVWNGFPGRAYVMAVAFTAAYACTDEIHQSFVGGRDCRISDMCIDTAGAVIGILVLIAARRVLRWRRET